MLGVKLGAERCNVDRLQDETRKLVHNIERVTARAKHAEVTLGKVGEK